MRDTSHLDALRAGLSNERIRLANARSAQERALRSVWVAQSEKEVAFEMKMLGITHEPEPDLTDDELLAALGV